ncbi:ubiquitin-conjugating enzyme3 like-protein [Lactarius tabidus]
MTPNGNAKIPTKFYQEDIVQRNNSRSYGIVLRCWHDSDDTAPPQDQHDPLMRPLERGEVGVSFFPNGIREILPESEFTLVDRMFQPGDLCKRSIDDVRSGVIISVDVKGRLEHAISGEPVPDWKSMNDIEIPADVDIGDYVAYDNWIGQVVELFDEAVVDVSNGQLVRLPELSSRLTVGEKGSDIIPPPASVGNLFGFFSRPLRNGHSATVVDVKHSVLAISWLAINQSLPTEAAQLVARPGRFWSGEHLAKLKLVRSRAEWMMRVGDKVILKDATNLPSTRHGKEGEPYGVIEVRVYVVRETQTTVDVLWQDGSTEAMLTTKLIPYLNPDEYDCWPGDHVLWKGEDEKRVAVVQSVNAVDRTATIRFGDTGAIELASVLELDPHGTNDWSAVAPTTFDGLGVRRGDFVFIHREGTTNGLEKPKVPRIGEVEPWVREPPIVHADGHYGGWRKTMADIGMNIAHRREPDHIVEGRIRKPGPDNTSLNWFGEVSNLGLDGSVEVTLPNGAVAKYPLERLTRLYDTLEQLEDLWGEGSAQDEQEHEHEHEHETEVWAMDEDGIWQAQANGDDNDEWEETDEEEEYGMEVEGDAQMEDIHAPDNEVHTSWWDHIVPTVTAVPADQQDTASVSQVPSSTLRSSSPDVPRDATEKEDVLVDEVGMNGAEDEERESNWKRFEVVPEAPRDHAFFNSTPSQPSRNFLTRLQKEYRALSSSLPESILVRAYEDRSDLLRSLIIGPENTPYEDAPFVIDWMLDSDFPQSPPIAHFLSWTNGNGRVNPNLYEEGKVCLSILGTWAGDRSESWSPARSSLLQALVSIQGLVLVKEPWFCEPAYDKLRGTEEGIINSRLYNEKAYVLSRGFVRRALEVPLGSLEGEIGWLYRKQGRLAKVLCEARALVEKSRTEPSAQSSNAAAAAGGDRDSEPAVPRLTAGGIITLERTLVKLEALQLAPAP